MVDNGWTTPVLEAAEGSTAAASIAPIGTAAAGPSVIVT